MKIRCVTGGSRPIGLSAMRIIIAIASAVLFPIVSMAEGKAAQPQATAEQKQPVVLLKDDFSDATKSKQLWQSNTKFTREACDFSEEKNNRLTFGGINHHYVYTSADPASANWSDLTYELTVDYISHGTNTPVRWGDCWFGVFLRGQLLFATSPATGVCVWYETNGQPHYADTAIAGRFADGTSSKLKFICKGDTVEAILDGKTVIKVPNAGGKGCLGFGEWNCRVSVSNITVTQL
ncbi:MAG TPA: hypothetical protein VHV83_06980 [Armatimonadota bacterium]|nr:hypothetical protein [Armatimonadota bacterium]